MNRKRFDDEIEIVITRLSLRVILVHPFLLIEGQQKLKSWQGHPPIRPGILGHSAANAGPVLGFGMPRSATYNG